MEYTFACVLLVVVDQRPLVRVRRQLFVPLVEQVSELESSTKLLLFPMTVRGSEAAAVVEGSSSSPFDTLLSEPIPSAD